MSHFRVLGLHAACQLARLRYVLCPVLAGMLGFVNRAVQPFDYVYFAQAGGHVWSGELADVYRDASVQAGPIQLMLASLARTLNGLSRNLDLVALHVFGAALMVTGLMWLARRTRRHFGLTAAPSIELAIGLTAIMIGWAGNATALGHPAEVAIPALWLSAAMAIQRERPYVAAVFLGISTGFETWALLGFIVILLADHRRDVLRALAGACAVTGVLWLPFVVSGGFHMSQMQWQIAPGTPVSELLRAANFSTAMRLVQLVVALGAGAAVAVSTRNSRHSVWLPLLAAVLARLWLDPLQVGYYWLVPLTLILAVLATATPDGKELTAISVLLACSQTAAFRGADKPEELAVSSLLVFIAVAVVRRPQLLHLGRHSMTRLPAESPS